MPKNRIDEGDFDSSDQAIAHARVLARVLSGTKLPRGACLRVVDERGGVLLQLPLDKRDN